MREDGGKLVVRISNESDEGILVDIADTGPGIPADIQEKIFNLYYTTRQNGNGIGLAITKQIVDAHNGQISVTSVPGGTVFRVMLPKAKK
jgi:signal transduction histidine kinase